MTTVRRGIPKGLPPEIDDTARKLRRTLKGKENFTGIKVLGDNKAGFLDKVESDALADPTGLAAAVVETAAVDGDAITNYAASSTSAIQTLTGDTPCMVATLAYASLGGRLSIRANFFMEVWHPAAGGINAQIRIRRTPPNGNVFDQTFSAIGDDFLTGWQTPEVVETPAAGTYTYEVWITLNKNDAADEEVSAMVLSITEAKR